VSNAESLITESEISKPHTTEADVSNVVSPKLPEEMLNPNSEISQGFIQSTESILFGTQKKYQDQLAELRSLAVNEANLPNISMKFIMRINDALVELSAPTFAEISSKTRNARR